jgi:hypothetical protein
LSILGRIASLAPFAVRGLARGAGTVTGSIGRGFLAWTLVDKISNSVEELSDEIGELADDENTFPPPGSDPEEPEAEDDPEDEEDDENDLLFNDFFGTGGEEDGGGNSFAGGDDPGYYDDPGDVGGGTEQPSEPSVPVVELLRRGLVAGSRGKLTSDNAIDRCLRLPVRTTEDIARFKACLEDILDEQSVPVSRRASRILGSIER